MNKNKGWIMKQTWNDLLFLHWPVDPSWLQELLPSQLEVDTYEDEAWIGIVSFEMNKIRFRGLPAVPFASRLLELNVRTYVRYGNKTGVYFFSLDANHRLGVWIARSVFHLPYFQAALSKVEKDEVIDFRGERTHKDMKQARLHIKYEPLSEPYEAKEGNLDFWLTERDCLFNVHNGSVYRGDIKHERWPLQKADFTILEDSLSDDYFYDKEHAVAHFSRSVTTYLWPFKRISDK